MSVPIESSPSARLIAQDSSTSQRRISSDLPGSHRIEVRSIDPATGNPSFVVSHEAPADAEHSFADRAAAHLTQIAPVLGVGLLMGVDFRIDPQPATTSSGATVVHSQQQYMGIGIFQAAETVRFDPSGTLEATAGRTVTVHHARPRLPKITSEQAAPPRDPACCGAFGKIRESSSVSLWRAAPVVL